MQLQNTEMHMNLTEVTCQAIVMKAKVFKKKNSRITNLWAPEGPGKFGIAQTRPESWSRVRKAPALHRKNKFFSALKTYGRKLPKKKTNPTKNQSNTTMRYLREERHKMQRGDWHIESFRSQMSPTSHF